MKLKTAVIAIKFIVELLPIKRNSREFLTDQ